ncbi:MAG: histidine phosphatase family protein [Rickettsiaceae bacterium]|nr:histidine phosphatase family protein [Rickettsiaceae bacterium]
MRNIILMRHADAPNFDDNGNIISDFDRALSKTGEEQARETALALKSEFEIDLIISSNAPRAFRTAKYLLEQFPDTFFRQEELLYTESSEIIKRFIWSIEDDFATICIVGHNPSISSVARDLSNGEYVSTLKPAEYVVTKHDI